MARGEIFGFACEGSFYLQTSLQEGMAMSVVEAMQLGLVPVVTPVGQIATYCRDGENSILVGDDDDVVVRRLKTLATNPAMFRDLADGAHSTWLEKWRSLTRQRSPE
jgi:glycosyltransferase involved in cell wall biosynthesis